MQTTLSTLQLTGNPVYDGYFADPFVWRHEGHYYAVGTNKTGTGELGDQGEERVIPLLHSPDLRHWEEAGCVLIRPDVGLGHQFWAPEVAFHDGTFYLYYSVGPAHQLRVATSDSPFGPFRDCGHFLTGAPQTPFAIDASAFQDDDGQWYLFYARDFLDREGGFHFGTALVMDRLETMTRLAGTPQTVLRARHPWTLNGHNYSSHGRVWDTWHTLEGACVRKREGRYYCFYSGATYQNENYGVDYAVADEVWGPYSDAGGESGPRVLKSAPGLIGPGHNSLVEGPDGADYIVYHAWNADHTARQMCIDRLDWTPDGPRCTPTPSSPL